MGGRFREWLNKDSQLIATLQMAGANSNSVLIAKLDRGENPLSSQELKTILIGTDFEIGLKRKETHNLDISLKKK